LPAVIGPCAIDGILLRFEVCDATIDRLPHLIGVDVVLGGANRTSGGEYEAGQDGRRDREMPDHDDPLEMIWAGAH